MEDVQGIVDEQKPVCGEYQDDKSIMAVFLVGNEEEILEYEKPVIDKKEKIFAALAFYEPSYLMFVSFFKITKLDNKKINT